MIDSNAAKVIVILLIAAAIGLGVIIANAIAHRRHLRRLRRSQTARVEQMVARSNACDHLRNRQHDSGHRICTDCGLVLVQNSRAVQDRCPHTRLRWGGRCQVCGWTNGSGV